jgi:hypothetical protein
VVDARAGPLTSPAQTQIAVVWHVDLSGTWRYGQQYSRQIHQTRPAAGSAIAVAFPLLSSFDVHVLGLSPWRAEDPPLAPVSVSSSVYSTRIRLGWSEPLEGSPCIHRATPSEHESLRAECSATTQCCSSTSAYAQNQLFHPLLIYMIFEYEAY